LSKASGRIQLVQADFIQNPSALEELTNKRAGATHPTFGEKKGPETL
jgi:hypothetical protein